MEILPSTEKLSISRVSQARKNKSTFYLEPESYKYTDDDLARARAKAMKVMEKYHPKS